MGTKVYPHGYRTYSLSLSWSSHEPIAMGFYLVIGPHAPLVDWPFHYHFSLAENCVSAPRKVSILTRTTAVRVLSTLLGIPWTYLFHHLTTIYGMSNNSNSETSLFLTPFIFILHFLSTPLFYSLFFPAGPVSPYRPILFGAGSPSAWGIRDGSPTL